VERFEEGAIRDDKDEGYAEIERYCKPGEPRERDHSREDAALLKSGAEAEVSPGIRGDCGPDYPEHPNNEEADEFAAERGNKIVLDAFVDGVEEETGPGHGHHGSNKQFDHIWIVEASPSVQRVSTRQIVRVRQAGNGEAEYDEREESQDAIRNLPESWEIERHGSRSTQEGGRGTWECR